MAFVLFKSGGFDVHVRNSRSSLLITALSVLSAAAASHADDETAHGGGEKEAEASTYETVVQGYRIWATDETTGFAETIEVSDESQTMSSLSEVLSASVGVQVRRLGGVGALGEASIRGSSSNQVPVLLDGVELNVGGSPAVDMGAFALDVFEEVEI